MKKSLITVSFLVTIIAGCKPKAVQTSQPTAKEDCTTINITYASGIKQIVDEQCASSCHSARNKAHDIDLSTYEKVKMEAAKPAFMGSIRHESGYDAMPRFSSKLDDATIAKLSCWIKNGYQQ